MGDLAIRAERLSKAYAIAGEQARHDTLRDSLSAIFRPRSKAEKSTFWALQNASFEVRQGENVGVLGLNGAGKSTLLKVLSRITDPTAGVARLNGRVGCLLEVGTGFHRELTGRENIFFYGAILGMSRAEIVRKLDAIVSFAEVETFLDTPVKHYSSGMYVRLAFSVAAHLEPDILLLDEVLSVGDLPFQRKCLEFAKSLQNRQATILFVSHNMFSIKTMCERVIYLRKGRIVYDGPTDAGIDLYEKEGRLEVAPWAARELQGAPLSIEDVAITDVGKMPRAIFDHGEPMRLQIDYRASEALPRCNFIVVFIRSDGLAVCNYSGELDAMPVDVRPGRGRIVLTTPPLSLVSDVYRIEVLVRAPGFGKLLCAQSGGTFHIRDSLLDAHFGVFHEPGAWSAMEEPPMGRPKLRIVGTDP